MIEEEGIGLDQDHTIGETEVIETGEIEGADLSEEDLDLMRETEGETMIGIEEGIMIEGEVVMVVADLKIEDSEREATLETMKTREAHSTIQETETLTIEIEMTQEIRESTETDHESYS